MTATAERLNLVLSDIGSQSAGCRASRNDLVPAYERRSGGACIATRPTRGQRVNLAFLYDELTLLDLAGPIEGVPCAASAERHFVALSNEPVGSDSVVTITSKQMARSDPR
jgi:hypothetical protein